HRAAGRYCQHRCRRLCRYRCQFQRDAAHAPARFRGHRTGAPRENCQSMKAAKFDYLVAKTVADAAASLASAGPSSAIIAGGQSLVPMLNLRVAVADVLVDISAIEDLKLTSLTANRMRIGALTTHADIEDGKTPDPFGGLLRKVAAGSFQPWTRTHRNGSWGVHPCDS